MEPLTSIKEVQQLTERMATLGCFLSKSAERKLPFLRTLRAGKKFEWTEQCQKSFEALKEYLKEVPLLTRPETRETLYLYLGISEEAISAILIRKEGQVDRPIYYVIKVLQGPKTCYPFAEKVALALLNASKKLRSYFQAHSIIVLTDQPLRSILQKPECSGRLTKWSIELSEYDIQYQPRQAIKGSQGSEAGIILVPPEGETLEYSLRFAFPSTNNVAEYEALIAGMREQVMAQYLRKVKDLAHMFQSFQLMQINRSLNGHADVLTKLASTKETAGRTVFVELLHQSSIEKKEVSFFEARIDWRMPLYHYLTSSELPNDSQEVRRLKIQTARFTIIDGVFYKRVFTTPLLKCLGPQEAEYTLAKTHSRVCGEHLGSRALATTVLREEALIPIEILAKSPRLMVYEEENGARNSEALRENLDLIEEQ
ncbi:uncharacterized protein LOC127809283 [Diospyros lotus]|uniref:uncharacterized protein LOC127809283 n=1 Tax=Diospyros lotus TaxID=55363 RepID=UPI00225BA9DE|nr:uncharacterized protein LOC127809283 [Diospyros lotus]